jgi:hypothetical protein
MLLVALLGAAVGLVLLATVLIGGGGAGGPATGAAAIVPSDALAYVHVSTDRGRPEVDRALATVEKFPSFPLASAALLTRIGVGTPPAQLNQWLGRDAAFAELDTGPLVVLDQRNPAAARRALTSAGAVSAGKYRGHQLLRVPTGQEAAFVNTHYAVLGNDATVRAAIDTASSNRTALPDNPGYRRAASGEPTDRVLDAYISAAGVRRLLHGRAGIRGALAAVFSQSTLTGASLTVSPAAHGLKVRIHTAFDAGITGLNQGAPSNFTPTLQRVIPAGAPVMLDLTGLDHAAPQLLSAGAAAGIGSTIGPLLSRLGEALSAEGVNVSQVLSIFRGETAVAVSPGASGTPSLLIVTRAKDEERARRTLAELEPPLAHLFANTATQAGQAPLLNDVQVGTATVHQLALAPGLQLDYTVSNGLVVIGTSLSAVSSVLQRTRAITSNQSYKTVLPTHPTKVTSLLFLDFTQLLSIVEQAGLARGARFTALRPDFQMIRAAGLQSTNGEADSTAELFLQIP